jgi:hypothetical protein
MLRPPINKTLGPRSTFSKMKMLQKVQEMKRTNQALDQELSEWERKLMTAGDDSQLANIDLQNMLQKQQQTIQMLSNVSKVLHDTALAVIRKIG